MNEKRTLEIVFAGATLLITGLGVYLTWKYRKTTAAGASIPAAAAPPIPGGASATRTTQTAQTLANQTNQYLPGQLKTVMVPGKVPPATSPTPSATAAQTALAQNILAIRAPGTGATLAGVAGYAAVKGAAVTSAGVGNALKTVATPGSPEENATFLRTSYEPVVGGYQSQTGDALKSFSGELNAGASGLGVASLATFAAKSLGIRGKTEKQQASIFGQADLAALQGAIGAIPIVGQIVSPLLGLGAGTYEGKRAVAEAGRITEQGYTAQKEIVSGHVSEAFSGGGTDHAQRVAAATAQQKADLLKLNAGQSAEAARNAEAIDASAGTGTAFQKSQNTIAAANQAILKSVGGDATKLSGAQFTQLYGDAQTQAYRAAAATAAQKANDAATAAIAAENAKRKPGFGSGILAQQGFGF